MASKPSSEKDISQALKCSPSEQLTAFLPKSFFSVRHNSALGVRGFSDGHELNQEMGGVLALSSVCRKGLCTKAFTGYGPALSRGQLCPCGGFYLPAWLYFLFPSSQNK